MFHVKLDPYSLVEALRPDQRSALRRFQEILIERAVPHGLVSVRDRDRIWERHILDSLRAVACLEEQSRSIGDLGSGAGLPGIPVAVVRPDCHVTLFEGRRGRAAFLEQVVERLALANVTVLPHRIEECRSVFDLCLARALADLAASWRLADPCLRPGGSLLYFAGGSFSPEECAAIANVTCEICLPGRFPRQGPLVMITREPGPLRAEGDT